MKTESLVIKCKNSLVNMFQICVHIAHQVLGRDILTYWYSYY